MEQQTKNEQNPKILLDFYTIFKTYTQTKDKSLTSYFGLSPVVNCLNMCTIYEKQCVMKQQTKYEQNQNGS